MIKPTIKAVALERLLDGLAKRTESIQARRCVAPPFGCGQVIKGFRDNLSQKEYNISGLCQKCQDAYFEPADQEVEEENNSKW